MKFPFNLDQLNASNVANQFILMAGPCAIENEETPYLIAEKVSKICNAYQIP